NLLLADASYPVIDSSKIYKSTDGGFNWSLKFKVGDSEIPTITNSIFDYNKSWAAAEKLYSSSNFGETWTGIANSFDVLWALDICKEDPTCIFTARFSGQGFLSTNGGISFSNVNHPNSSVFFSAVLFPERDYAIGMFNNSVYKLKFTYDVTVGIVKTPGIVPDNFILYQNYPNPFNPKTTINYSIPVSGYVSLEVFDALGKEVYSLVNQKQYSGNYKAEFDGINLTSGIYFYQLRSGKFSETKKMLLIK
ncbi:MAG: T9SS type A sorting domain-containing protein, partial [bacterium]